MVVSGAGESYSSSPSPSSSLSSSSGYHSVSMRVASEWEARSMLTTSSSKRARSPAMAWSARVRSAVGLAEARN